MPVLEVKDLNISFFGSPVIENLSFSVDQGQTLAVIGPNGAGKTVLFKVLLGLVPYTGKITWQKNVKIGYVPQRFAVESDLPLSVSEFFGLKNIPAKDVAHSLDHVGFRENRKSLMDTRLGNLSGGQLQRVLIAWALSDHPSVLLFDEPTTGVDISVEESIYNLLHRLQKDHNLTVLLISHELQVVYKYASNVLCLNREGLCFGPPAKALTQSTLSRLFGDDTSLYQHQHHP